MGREKVKREPVNVEAAELNVLCSSLLIGSLSIDAEARRGIPCDPFQRVVR